MGSGALHNRVNLFIMLPLCLVGFSIWAPIDLVTAAVFSASFVYATLFAGPDMDLANQIRLLSFRGMCTLPFRLFYAPLVRHRGRVSHSLLLGTPSRLLCLAVFLFTALFLWLFVLQFWAGGVGPRHLPELWRQTVAAAGGVIESLLEGAGRHRLPAAAGVVGFLAADSSHVLLDRLS